MSLIDWLDGTTGFLISVDENRQFGLSGYFRPIHTRQVSTFDTDFSCFQNRWPFAAMQAAVNESTASPAS